MKFGGTTTTLHHHFITPSSTYPHTQLIELTAQAAPKPLSIQQITFCPLQSFFSKLERLDNVFVFNRSPKSGITSLYRVGGQTAGIK